MRALARSLLLDRGRGVFGYLDVACATNIPPAVSQTLHNPGCSLSGSNNFNHFGVALEAFRS